MGAGGGGRACHHSIILNQLSSELTHEVGGGVPCARIGREESSRSWWPCCAFSPDATAARNQFRRNREPASSTLGIPNRSPRTRSVRAWAKTSQVKAVASFSVSTPALCLTPVESVLCRAEANESVLPTGYVACEIAWETVRKLGPAFLPAVGFRGRSGPGMELRNADRSDEAPLKLTEVSNELQIRRL